MTNRTRIWFQKHAAAGRIPVLDAAYEAHARRVLRPDTEVRFAGLPPETYKTPLPHDLVRYYYAESLFSQYFAERAIDAERQGYDAFICGAGQDPGLLIARSAVRIPVVGYGEASMLIACQLGQRFGFVGFIPEVQTAIRANARTYGLESRCGPAVTIGDGADLLGRAFAGEPAPFLEAFEAAARHAIAEGADVLIPSEGPINELLIVNGIHDVDGAAIVDSHGVALKLAEMLADLRRLSGQSPSRIGYFQATPQSDLVDHLRQIYLAPQP